MAALETFARRIRGEIFFARRWFLVEGQAEYLVVPALARSMGYDLDEQGVALIDAVNNGNPTTFAILARALSIPWLAVFDGDDAGRGYCQAIPNREFDPAFVAARCVVLPAGNLEDQLLADGWEADLRSILQGLGHADATTITPVVLKERLTRNKIPYAAALALRLRADATLAPRMPAAYPLFPNLI